MFLMVIYIFILVPTVKIHPFKNSSNNNGDNGSVSGRSNPNCSPSKIENPNQTSAMAEKEKVDLYKTAGEDVISVILPVLDDFERAQKAMAE